MLIEELVLKPSTTTEKTPPFGAVTTRTPMLGPANEPIDQSKSTVVWETRRTSIIVRDRRVNGVSDMEGFVERAIRISMGGVPCIGGSVYNSTGGSSRRYYACRCGWI